MPTWILRGATLDRDQAAEWQRHGDASSATDTAPVRHMRGPQDYATHHIGRGTKWIKPGKQQ